MARSVYFDPFGMRTTGYRAGIQDETGLQDTTRQARYSDAMFPFTVNRARREDQLGAAQLPFQMRQLPRAERAQELSLWGLEDPVQAAVGRRTGNFAGQARNDLGILGAQLGMRPGQTFNDGVDEFGNPMSYTEQQPFYQLPDIYGQLQEAPLDYQNMLDAYQTEAFRPQAMQDMEAQMQWDRLGINQQVAQMQQMQAMAEIQRRQEQMRQIQELQDMGYFVSPISGQVINPGGGAADDDAYTY